MAREAAPALLVGGDPAGGPLGVGDEPARPAVARGERRGPVTGGATCFAAAIFGGVTRRAAGGDEPVTPARRRPARAAGCRGTFGGANFAAGLFAARRFGAAPRGAAGFAGPVLAIFTTAATVSSLGRPDTTPTPGSASSTPRRYGSSAVMTKRRVSPLWRRSRARRGAGSPRPDSGT
jgi:hypothetical protein